MVTAKYRMTVRDVNALVANNALGASLTVRGALSCQALMTQRKTGEAYLQVEVAHTNGLVVLCGKEPLHHTAHLEHIQVNCSPAIQVPVNMADCKRRIESTPCATCAPMQQQRRQRELYRIVRMRCHPDARAPRTDHSLQWLL